MKVPYTIALLLALSLSSLSWGRELEDLEAGASVRSKSKPDIDYRVQQVTPRGVWVVIPNRGGIIQALSGKAPTGERRVFLDRDRVQGVNPLAPLKPEDFTGRDGFKRLQEILRDDASAADRVYDSGASEIFGPLRAREARLRALLKKTRNKELAAVLEEELRVQTAPMRGYVRDALVRQLVQLGAKDRIGATKKAWELSLEAEALGDSSAASQADLKALAGVRGALQSDLERDLAAEIDRDRSRGHLRAMELFEDFKALLGERKAPKDMAGFLESLKRARDYTQPDQQYSAAHDLGPLPRFDAGAPLEEGARHGGVGPAGPLPWNTAPAPEEPRLEEVPSDPGLEPEAEVRKLFEDALRGDPAGLQKSLLEEEAELLRFRGLPGGELNPSLVQVRGQLRDTSEHLQRIAGEALESDPVAFAAELYRRGEAYERALRRLPRNLGAGYRRALRQISQLLGRAREASRGRAKRLTAAQGAQALSKLRRRTAEAAARGLSGLAKQLQREEAEIRRRIK